MLLLVVWIIITACLLVSVSNLLHRMQDCTLYGILVHHKIWAHDTGAEWTTLATSSAKNRTFKTSWASSAWFDSINCIMLQCILFIRRHCCPVSQSVGPTWDLLCLAVSLFCILHTSYSDLSFPAELHCESKKTAPFYFCNIFVKPSSILIIFGTCIPW